MTTDLRIPAVFVRGGTSRAVLFHGRDLAGFGADERDTVILTALGSPDPDGREVDGLGGGTSSLSKAAIISPSKLPDLDVEFEFAQVEVERPFVDWSGTCGNISSAVGPFAIDEGLVNAVEPITEVRVLAVNTGKRFVARVPVRNGRSASDGEFAIDGVPGNAARIDLEYIEPAGSLGSGTLPTGMSRECVDLPSGGNLAISIVDVAIPTVFVRASDVGADPRATAAELDNETGLRRRLEEVRCTGAVRMGLCEDPEEAHVQLRAVPKVALIAPPARYETSDGRLVASADVDILARAVSMERFHRTYPTSVSMATAVAARIDGTLVAEAAMDTAPGPVRIGHPAGVMPIDCSVEPDGERWRVPRVTTYRTARRIMEGNVLIPLSRLKRRSQLKAVASPDV